LVNVSPVALISKWINTWRVYSPQLPPRYMVNDVGLDTSLFRAIRNSPKHVLVSLFLCKRQSRLSRYEQ